MPNRKKEPDFQKEENLKVLETFAGAVLWLDEEGKIIHVSDPFFELFKIEKESVQGSNWTNLDIGFSQTAFGAMWDKLCTDDFVDWHTTLQFDTKKKHEVLVEGRIVQNDLCEFACLRVSIIQKTESDRQLLHILTESSKSAVWNWDLTKGNFNITDSFFPLFSIPVKAYGDDSTNIIKLLQPFLTNDQFEELKTKVLRLGEKQKKLTYTWSPMINGVPKKIILNAFPMLKNGKRTAISGTVRHADRKIKRELLNSIASTALEQSGNLVLILNENFNIVHANEFALDNLGFEKTDLDDGLSIFKIDIEQSMNQWTKHLEKLKTGKNLLLVTSFQRKGATILPVELTVTHYQDFHSQLICVLAKDISEVRKKESILKADLADKTSIARQLEEKTEYLQKESSKNFKLENIVSASKNYLPVLAKIKQVAPTLSTVMIEGETGTGKELVARAIHQLSSRANRSMIVVNCANLPRELIESELFGHEKGAFTGAIKQKKGRFELADKGTLFLDEIGEMPMQMQTRLLRVLQEGDFERVGGTKTIHIDTRIIAATNRDLQAMVEENKFREDLYYRLNVFPIQNIPLRERKEDVKPLAYHFLNRYSTKMNRQVTDITKKDLERLMEYNFPGNIRELENIIERSVILSTGTTLDLDFWQPATSLLSAKGNEKFITFEEVQKKHIIKALEITKWKISGKKGAAELLGMNDQTLFSKMRKLGISLN